METPLVPRSPEPRHEGKRGARAAVPPARLARLLELSRALAGACEHSDIAVIAAERARTVTGASAAQVLASREGGPLSVIAEATGAAAARRPSAPAATGAKGPEPEVVRTGEPLWIRSRGEASAHRPAIPLDALTGGPDAASWAFLPLVADGEPTGILTLAFDGVQAFDDATRAFLCEVAAACGDALARGSLFTQARARANASEEARAACELRERRSDGQIADRTHLYERERFARARAEAETVVAVHAAEDLERILPLTAALFVADTAPAVVAVLSEHGAAAFGALGVELTRRGAGGGTPTRSEADAAEAEVLRGGAPLWLDPKELARRFPETAAALRARGAGSWLGVPVAGDDRVEAVLSLAFPRERAFTPADRARLTLLAHGCASVLARCTARDARATAEAEREATASRPAGAFVAQFEEVGVDGPVTHILGVFSSETSARDALRELERTRSLVVHASITSWTLDVAGPRTSVEIDL